MNTSSTQSGKNTHSSTVDSNAIVDRYMDRPTKESDHSKPSDNPDVSKITHIKSQSLPSSPANQSQDVKINVNELKSTPPKPSLLSDPTLTKEERLLRNIEETKDVMQDNIEKMMQRGDKMDDLGVQVEMLEEQTGGFSAEARKTHERTKYLNRRSKMICSMVAFSLVIIVVGLAIVAILWH